MENVLMIAGSVIGSIFIIVLLARSFRRIAPPNQVYVVSGGSSLRKVYGGGVWVWPVVNQLSKLDMTISSVGIKINNVYSKGGIPLDVQAIADVKISADPRYINNAIERFMGKSNNEILRVAKETLEGGLRGVVSTLTPEEVNEDRMSFADRVAQDVEHEMNKLGLQLDVFKIQAVSDNIDYLKALSRARISNILKEAEIAESNLINAAKKVESEEQKKGRVAETITKDIIKQKENEFREIKADLTAKIQAEEETTIAAAKEAEAIAEKELQQLKSKLQEVKLQVEEVIPAKADQKAAEIIARGEAANISEQGRAMAYQIEVMSQVWKEAGKDALPIALMQKIETILTSAASTVQELHIKKVHLIDSGDGETIKGIVNAYTGMISTVFNSLNEILGVDIIESLNKKEL